MQDPIPYQCIHYTHCILAGTLHLKFISTPTLSRFLQLPTLSPCSQKSTFMKMVSSVWWAMLKIYHIFFFLYVSGLQTTIALYISQLSEQISWDTVENTSPKSYYFSYWELTLADPQLTVLKPVLMPVTSPAEKVWADKHHTVTHDHGPASCHPLLGGGIKRIGSSSRPSSGSNLAYRISVK